MKEFPSVQNDNNTSGFSKVQEIHQKLTKMIFYEKFQVSWKNILK